MEKERIDTVAIQETKIDYKANYQNNKYTWSTSGANRLEKDCSFANVVVFVIKNELLNYIMDIEPINDRVIKTILKCKSPIVVFGV